MGTIEWIILYSYSDSRACRRGRQDVIRSVAKSALKAAYKVNDTSENSLTWGSGFCPIQQPCLSPECQNVPCLTVVLCKYRVSWETQSPVCTHRIISVHDYFKFIQRSQSATEDCVGSVMKNTCWFFFPLPLFFTGRTLRPPWDKSPRPRAADPRLLENVLPDFI